jgi:tRNA dimethylallyltransferase
MDTTIGIKKNKCIVIAGQTASGKSSLAVHVALFLKEKGINSAVISADSRQVFTGGDLISAKMNNDEMCGIPHYMLSITDIQNDYSVAEYKNTAREIIEDLHKQNIVPIICGGTGLYIDNLVFNKTIPEVLPNWDLRKELEDKSIDELYKILETKDPSRAENIDPKNKRRIIRALEIIDSIGTVPNLVEPELVYDTLFIGLYADTDILQNRIQNRTELRFNKNMFGEIIKYIEEDKVSKEKLLSMGMEYKWLTMLYDKKTDQEDCIHNINRDSLKYAKRQMTWFKKNKFIKWINTNNIKIAENKAINLVSEFIA